MTQINYSPIWQRVTKKLCDCLCVQLGPGSLRNKILKRFPIQDMTDAQVFALLTEKTPEETRNYLQRVTDRMSLYEELVRQ